MKNLYFLCFSLLIISCGEHEENQDKTRTPAAEEVTRPVSETNPQVLIDTEGERVITREEKDNEASVTQTEDWLQPNFLTADFNGDGHPDTAFAIIEDMKKGINIKHGGTDESFVIGAGVNFGNGGDDFSWVDTWNLVTDTTTNEVLFTDSGDVAGSREVVLAHPAFYLGSELGGATISWKDGKYHWIHQAD